MTAEVAEVGHVSEDRTGQGHAAEEDRTGHGQGEEDPEEGHEADQMTDEGTQDHGLNNKLFY